MRFYRDLAGWWPLFSPPVHYVEEAADLLSRLAPLPPPGQATLLELGSGGGSLAHHLGHQFKLTLTDLSEGMLAESRAINPEAEHVAGDMRIASRPVAEILSSILRQIGIVACAITNEVGTFMATVIGNLLHGAIGDRAGLARKAL